MLLRQGRRIAHEETDADDGRSPCPCAADADGTGGGVTLDLSGGSFADLAELTALMDQQEGVSTVDLTDVPLTMDERRELLARYPGTH